MNNEIKEILDMFIKYKDDWYLCEYKLKPRQCVILYDYITNLQQENERKKRLITQYGEGMCAYADRIDKAIEYIKAGKTFDNEDTRKVVDKIQNDLLEILQNGSDKNVSDRN